MILSLFRSYPETGCNRFDNIERIFYLRASLKTYENLTNSLNELMLKAKPRIDKIIDEFIVSLTQQDMKAPTPDQLGKSLGVHIRRQLKDCFLSKFLITYNHRYSKNINKTLVIDLSEFNKFELDEKTIHSIIDDVLFLPEVMGGTISDFTSEFWNLKVTNTTLKEMNEYSSSFSHNIDLTRGPLAKRILILWDEKRKNRKTYALTTAFDDAVVELETINKEFAANFSAKKSVYYDWLKKWKKSYLTKEKKLLLKQLNNIPDMTFYKDKSVNQFNKI